MAEIAILTDYEKEVFAQLAAMHPSSNLPLKQKPGTKSHDKVVAAIKKYIDLNNNVAFNEAYTKIYKY